MAFLKRYPYYRDNNFQNTTSEHLNRQNLHCPGLKKKPEKWRTKKWQRDAEKLIRVGRSYLLGPNGKERISYLANERGLDLDTIRQRRLGWLPEKRHMPSKLLIPCYDSQGHLIRIRFVLILLVLDNNGTESARAVIRTHLIP